MKTKLLILPVIASIFAVVTGCQTQPPLAAPSQAASVETMVAKAPANSIRINAGADALKDSSGVQWLGDTGFSGGDVIDRADMQIANTTQPEIYRSEHYSMDSFTKKLANGKYLVKLHFCETFEGITGPGERVFAFEIAGKTFKDFDVWAKAGGFAKAYVETVPVEITNGQLDIKFTPQMENPQINAVEIIPAP
jgi:hypothetical protein